MVKVLYIWYQCTVAFSGKVSAEGVNFDLTASL